MTHMHTFGTVNLNQGICGFTSTLYAVYANRPGQHKSLNKAGAHARTRLMAEIKTFLVMLRAQGKQSMLDEIQTLTRSFDGYEAWTPETFITQVNSAAQPEGVPAPEVDFSIAMPPGPLMEYLKICWDFNPVLETPRHGNGGNVILGLTRTGGPKNAFDNLAHYVYKTPAQKIQSWGKDFESIADLNKSSRYNYSIVSRIKIA